MKKTINCKITKKDALIAIIRQQEIKKHQISMKITMAVAEKKSVKDLKKTIKLNELGLKTLETLIKVNPKEIAEMAKNGLNMLTIGE